MFKAPAIFEVKIENFCVVIKKQNLKSKRGGEGGGGGCGGLVDIFNYWVMGHLLYFVFLLYMSMHVNRVLYFVTLEMK